MLLDHLKTIALSVGIDPAEALKMDFREFAVRVGARRAAREGQRIAMAVVARRRAVRS
jgi:hypothetical protein